MPTSLSAVAMVPVPSLRPSRQRRSGAGLVHANLGTVPAGGKLRVGRQLGAANAVSGAPRNASSTRSRVCGAIGSASASSRPNQPSRSTSSSHGRSAPPTTRAANEMPRSRPRRRSGRSAGTADRRGRPGPASAPPEPRLLERLPRRRVGRLLPGPSRRCPATARRRGCAPAAAAPPRPGPSPPPRAGGRGRARRGR